MVVIDYYSRYTELALLEKITSSDIIRHLKSIFARHGIPEVLRSDNGPQYKSEEFRRFAKYYDLKHETSSPKFPRSNGKAGRAAQIVKSLFRKNDDPYLALMIYRSTPQNNGFSPDELLFNRRIRTALPSIPIFKNTDHGYKKLQGNRGARVKSKRHYGKVHRARSQSFLENGDDVILKKTGETGRVMWKDETPRSYWMKTESGMLLRRNRKDIVENQNLKIMSLLELRKKKRKKRWRNIKIAKNVKMKIF